MEHEIPTGNTQHLADAIEKAAPGDTIKCHSDAMRELGQRASARMCPSKDLEFIVEAPPAPHFGPR